jgi:hypothetical protein
MFYIELTGNNGFWHSKYDNYYYYYLKDTTNLCSQERSSSVIQGAKRDPTNDCQCYNIFIVHARVFIFGT